MRFGQQQALPGAVFNSGLQAVQKVQTSRVGSGLGWQGFSHSQDCAVRRKLHRCVVPEPAMDVLEALEIPQLKRHRLTVENYHRMAETGVLSDDARVELVNGEIINMAPMGSKHHSAVLRLSSLLNQAVGAAAMVSTQLPIRLDEHNEPEPDLALLKFRPDFYAQALPTGADTLLVIEVSDTTLAYDVRIKAPLYARHGVPEMWVLDLANGLLHRFTAPRDGVYTDVSALKGPGVVDLPGLPGCGVDLSGVF